MKKSILLICCVLSSMVISCQKFDDTDIWDNINSLDKRVTALEELCKKMNSNIDALQALVKALEQHDYITNVAPITKEGEVIGYTISFAYGDPVTIYHGEDGKDGTDGSDGAPGQDGADGTDGKTPVIGVAKDTDGIYYWTVDGKWLVDADGNKIPTTGKDGADGTNGTPGQDGSDGADGANGITPQLKIENGQWYISYDNGITWVKLGQAIGDQGPQGETGTPGTDGADGDAFFSSVDYTSSSDYVVFTLSDGTQFQIPTWSAFEALRAQCEQMNANIEALQAIVAALQNNDYVTGVTPIYEGVTEIGYIISFSKSGNVTIYHGKDGADGSDGQTPVIGVAMNSDGIYYWTVNGSWLIDENGNKIPTTGADGSDGAPGADGTNGTPGQDGSDGADGITPQLKIENGLWYVSYDNGTTWTELGQATGDQGPQGDQGTPGVDGADGDAFFSSVDYTSSSDYVVFTLSDGTQFMIPTWSAFEALKAQCEQMNANIEALQSIVIALQNNDYVTGVTPIYEGVTEIGYIISFSKSGNVTIYHGKDGADGSDGQTPVIGVAMNSDGIYYWTVNGSWLIDENGNKIPTTGADGTDGQPGDDGSDGAFGQDGANGITPQLKIENGLWYVSYDNGTTWTELGQATGDQGPQGETGTPGTDGADGDAFFSSVDYTSSSDYVVFTLSDGTQFQIPTWSAFEALRAQCEQMNANIEALQAIVAALQNNDYVTGVTPIYEGVTEIGYIISFSKSGNVTIYHGKDGADGSDGQTPVIGVAMNSDGIYYWTINGSWLVDANGNKIPTTGADGSDGAPGADGANGTPGQDGSDGADGITPQLKIENGLWYVSYDNGETWTELGQATGDQGPQGEQGSPGADGADGDAFFSSVDYTSSSDFVIFTLSDGTQFQIPTWSAFEALKAQCEQMNANIEALQAIVSALQNNDYVTGVTPIYEGVTEIGYMISFSKSGNVTIYHGQDGQDGADGAPGQDGTDGQTPVIGVAMNSDGIYYWTVNGSWLIDENGNKIPTTGADGSDGAPGADGANGTPGQDGADGSDGITPQLKIEDGLWYVSYDNGTTWTELGQATGDQGPQGETGAAGQDGDSFFQSVTQDAEYVYIVLADGTEIVIPKTPLAPATLTLGEVTGFTATFNGTVNKSSLDLKVTVYYSTTDGLTVYKNKGSVSVTEFDGEAFTLRLTGLASETTYYYFTEVVGSGTKTFTSVSSFRTGEPDSYVDWEEGENIGGEI